MTKECTKCRETKLIADFHRNKSTADGRHKWCKECRSDLGRAERLESSANWREATELAAEGKRRCTECREVKPFAAFYRRSRSSRTGHKSQCIACCKVSSAKYTASEEGRAKRRVSHQRRVQSDPKRVKQLNREAAFRRKYGITMARYEEILEAQNGACAICEAAGSGVTLVVDHDHETGAVRGILCRTCNSGLGMFRDSVAFVERAFRYIQRGGAVRSVAPVGQPGNYP